MSFELQHVKRRIGTTQQIKKVTTALQQVASARLVGDRRIMETSHRYTQALADMLRILTMEITDSTHPLMLHRPALGKIGVLAFGSDRGLCGGFNAGLVERMEQFVGEYPGLELKVFAVGKVTARRIRRLGIPVLNVYTQPARDRRAETIDAITQRITLAFLEKEFDEIHLLYMRFTNGLLQEPVTERILPAPFDFANGGGPTARGYEPDPVTMLDTLLPEFVRQAVDHAFLNSLASENAARQAAMSRASENATEMLQDLRASYRRLRQESITTEMLELVGGGALL